MTHEDAENDNNDNQTPPPIPHHHHHHHHHASHTPTPPPQPSSDRPLLSLLRKNLLVLLLILALLLGIVLGVLLRLRKEPYSQRELMYLKFPGELLMNALKMLMIPLIVSNLVSGMTSLDARSSGRMGCRAVTYYFTSMASAAVLGIGLVMTIQPGRRGGHGSNGGDDGGGADGGGGREFRKVHPVDSLLDLIRQMFPDNIVEATFRKTLTKLVEKPLSSQPPNASANSSGNNTSEPELVPELEKIDGVNMLGLVVFSIALGLAINHLGPRGLPLKALCRSLADVTLVLITVIIWYSPIGLLFLVMGEVVSMKDPGQTLEQLFIYLLTVTLGMAIHGFITLPLLFFLVCRRSPYTFMYGVLPALITALGTSSSTATLPVTMRNLEENNGVDPRVVSFVIPVGTTVNMDGTALYEAVASLFIAQVEGVPMDLGTVIIVCLTAMAAAIGGAGIPQAALVTLVMVLAAVGLPADRVGLVLAIDWLIDRLRTVVNVLGDAFGAGIVHHLSKKDLARMDEEDKKAAAALATAAAAANDDDASTDTSIPSDG